MKRSLGLVLLLPVAALAQTPAPATQAEVPPQPLGHPLFCMADYPDSAVRAGRMGSATLLFRVTTNGNVAAVIVASSSGYDDLDAASVACANKWQFRSATQNGQPIEVPYAASIEWMINRPTWRISLALREPLNVCLSGEEPSSASRTSGATVVSYTLKNGEVSDVAVKSSSGNAALDQRAVACVATWHFEPQTVDPTTINTATLVQSPQDNPAPMARTPESLMPFAATGPGTAKFDWSEFGPQ